MKNIILTIAFILTFSLKSQAYFVNHGNVRVHPATQIGFFGNFVNNGTSNDEGQVNSMAGTTLQTIGGSAITTFNNLTIKNTNLNGVSLINSSKTKGILLMNSGILHTSLSNLFIMLNGSTTALGSSTSSSYVINPLPIELVNFRGQCNGKNTVLSWSTVSETDNEYFTIEKSFDGKTWITAVKVKGAGNSSGLKEYSVTDMEYYGTLVYYRLKQTGFDSQTKLFKFLVMANCGEKKVELVISPNPAKGIFNISFSNMEKQVRSIEIYNMIGERIYYATGYQSIIDISEKQSGVYFVHFNCSTGTVVKKIVNEK